MIVLPFAKEITVANHDKQLERKLFQQLVYKKVSAMFGVMFSQQECA